MRLGTYGVFRTTDSQPRDPAWCHKTAADRAKTGLNVETIAEVPYKTFPVFIRSDEPAKFRVHDD
jgi:hypothetical protein